MKLTSETVILRQSGILANDLGAETVMMSLEQGKYYGTNKTGSHIWKMLELPVTFGALCSKLAVDFSISEEQCAEEIKPFIEQMQKENIISIQ